MRSHKNLYDQIISESNLRLAFANAIRDKRRKPAVSKFLLLEEQRFHQLSAYFQSPNWKPGGYRTIIIKEPKPRLISVASFDDRIIHHAIHQVVAPILSRSFIFDSYACRINKGTHRAVLRFQEGLRKHQYIARLDVRRFFLEIHWDILLALISKRIADEKCLGIVNKVLESAKELYAQPDILSALGLSQSYSPKTRKGLPIGNLTSQLFANFYLDGLDHFAKRQLKIPLYIRYSDDVVIFGSSAKQVNNWRYQLRQWLQEHRELEIHQNRGMANSTRATFRFLGYIVNRHSRRIIYRSIRKMKAKLKARCRGGINNVQMKKLSLDTSATLRSWIL